VRLPFLIGTNLDGLDPSPFPKKKIFVSISIRFPIFQKIYSSKNVFVCGEMEKQDARGRLTLLGEVIEIGEKSSEEIQF